MAKFPNYPNLESFWLLLPKMLDGQLEKNKLKNTSLEYEFSLFRATLSPSVGRAVVLHPPGAAVIRPPLLAPATSSPVRRCHRCTRWRAGGEGSSGGGQRVSSSGSGGRQRASSSVVWVADQSAPIADHPSSPASMLAIASDGNLVLSDGATGHALWSTNVTAGVNSSASGGGGGAMAVLANSSNLVLRLPDGTALWETFEHPSNTFLPGMKIGVIYRTRGGVRLGTTDLSLGKFSFGGDPDQPLQVVIWKGSRVSWRTNPWEGYMVDSNYQKGGKSDELVGIGKDELAGGQTHGGGGARWCGEDELAGVGEDELASSLMCVGKQRERINW
uniref:non-specific serine/threonine protein kinase n=1 Tax=Oryza nivara TaxID=4536 RepID=A0A0E0IG69_ORYNI